jgi:hypothetical protein
MKKTREYWQYKWTIETKPVIELERSNGKIWAEHKFEIELLSPEWWSWNSQLLLFIAELENLWVFDDDKETTTYTYWYWNKDITTVPSIPPYNPLQPNILYSDHTIPCQSGITDQWENGLKSHNI